MIGSISSEVQGLNVIGSAFLMASPGDGAKSADSIRGEEQSDKIILTGAPERKDAAVYSTDEILGRAGGDGKLTDAQEEQVKELEAKDKEVRQHEQTHASMLGRYARGGPAYTYQAGPDGKAYAVGGSIEADVGAESTPEATAVKARTLMMASVSAGDPSPADLAVYARAAAMQNQAHGNRAVA